LKRRGINLEQHLAILDIRAQAKFPIKHNAGDPRAHLGHANGIDTSGQFRCQRHCFRCDGDHADVRRRLTVPDLLAAAAREKRRRGGSNQRHADQFTNSPNAAHVDIVPSFASTTGLTNEMDSIVCLRLLVALHHRLSFFP
jgi:hypothetical protein